MAKPATVAEVTVEAEVATVKTPTACPWRRHPAGRPSVRAGVGIGVRDGDGDEAARMTQFSGHAQGAQPQAGAHFPRRRGGHNVCS
ncbi:hypothetical protein [Streptomyces sp. WMMB 322]|uniref:hypothetical protein n=1 Tax=Streptomyces sp. WMMB 322 TaxID=1286821 RepID=UPI0006E43DE1|nr:hypothetical protein [Streptomyces sp. WMMB 322]SCK31458.1 hypothetical protein H180DRAFT_02504 [Streptomyces sp. WMMB 322]